MERAGNRLKGKAGVFRDTLRTTPAVLAGRTLGPSLIAAGELATDDLLAGAFDDLVARYRVWAVAAGEEADAVVGGLIGEWRTGYPAAMKATRLQHVEESASFFRSSLGQLATDRFYDPVGLDVGDATELVPTGFVRHVLATAGGTADVTSSGYAYVVMGSDDRGVGGLANGPDTMRAVRDHGGSLEAYRWVYGPARRTQPFHPHVRLDGVVFDRFDSAVLSNGSGWPPFAFYFPGDHNNCRCDFEPIMLTPAQAAAAGLTPKAGGAALTRAGRLADAADEFGVSPDEVRAALPRVTEMRKAIAADAAQTQAEAYRTLTAGGLHDAVQLRRPAKLAADRGVEWEWLQQIDQRERSRLSKLWYTDNPAASTLDDIADDWVRVGLADRNMGTSEIMEKVWLPANRRLDAAGAMRAGRLPAPRPYSDVLDANDLAPNVHASGVDVYRVLGVTDEQAAGYLASLDKGELIDEAYSALGAATTAELGPAPYNMSFQAWEAEVRDLEFGLREFPDELPASARQRYRELVPALLDEPGLDYESLYSGIIQTARLAELEVPATAQIPWAD